MSEQLDLMAPPPPQAASLSLPTSVPKVPHWPKARRQPNVQPASVVDSQAVSGRCRCGAPFQIPGLETSLCRKCGWVRSDQANSLTAEGLSK